MTIYNERCTIVANPNGTVKTVFVDRMGIDPDGRHYSIGQSTIGDAELEQFLSVSHIASLTTIVSLESDKKTLEETIVDLKATAASLETALQDSESESNQASRNLVVAQAKITQLLTEAYQTPE